MPVIVLLLLLLVPVAHAALPANELWREALISQYVGVGTVTGGAGGTLCTVTNLLDAGAGSLRNCVHFQSNRWIIFQEGLTGTIPSTSASINPGNNITIDGRGANITISPSAANTIIHIAATNVILTNLKFDNGGFDAVNIRPPYDRIWIDHVTTGQNFGDEAIDSICNLSPTGTTGMTFSWNYFSPIPAHEGPLLFTVGAVPADCSLNDVITMHHNYFDQVGRRTPFLEKAKVHGFNNYRKNTVACSNPPCMAVDVRSDGQYYSENEIFECGGTLCCATAACDGTPPHWVGGKWPRITVTNWTNPAPTQGQTAPDNMKMIGQWSVTGAETYQADLNPGTIFIPSALYSYTAAPANAALRDAIVAGAGWQNVTVPPGTPNAPTNLRVVSP